MEVVEDVAIQIEKEVQKILTAIKSTLVVSVWVLKIVRQLSKNTVERDSISTLSSITLRLPGLGLIFSSKNGLVLQQKIRKVYAS